MKTFYSSKSFILFISFDKVLCQFSVSTLNACQMSNPVSGSYASGRVLSVPAIVSASSTHTAKHQKYKNTRLFAKVERHRPPNVSNTVDDLYKFVS